MASLSRSLQAGPSREIHSRLLRPTCRRCSIAASRSSQLILSRPKSRAYLSTSARTSDNGSSFKRPSAMERAMSPSKGRKPASFEALGVPTPIVARLKAVFPGIRGPTPAQSAFIPAVLANKDVFLKDLTGRGKTLAVALAALSLATSRRYAGGAPNVLLLVPKIYLLHQLRQWLEMLQLPGESSKVHCLEPSHPVLPAKLPCILLTTPNALFKLETPPPLSAVHHIILDEPDSQIKPIPPRYYPAHLLSEHPINVHPPPATRILDHLLGIERTPDHKSDFTRRLNDVQTVWTSASLNAPFRALVHGRGWIRIDKEHVVNLDFATSTASLESSDAPVEHFCIAVDPVSGKLADLTEVSPPSPSNAGEISVKGLSFPPVLLEALAMLHISAPLPPSKTAIVLCPDETSLAKVGEELADLGLSAQILDPSEGVSPDDEEIAPDLYLLQRSLSSGLHLESLHTVYLLSGLDESSLTPSQKSMGGTNARIRAYDGYQGRVGRLGMETGEGEPQRVVTIVEGGGAEEQLMQKVFFTEHSADRAVKLSEWRWGGVGF